MSRETWSLIKQSKRFYINTYRRVGSVLLFSVSVNLCLGAAIYYIYFGQPENDFYATNGETSPELLTSMDTPNNTSAPILANDPDVDNTIKVIPQ